MAGIDVTAFQGANTAANPRLLDDGEATKASGVVLEERGSVRPLLAAGGSVLTGYGKNDAEGRMLFVLSSATDTIYRYTTPGPWDISTPTYDHNKSLVTAGGDTADLWFAPDGTKFLVLSGDTLDRVELWELSTPWNLTTATRTRTRTVSPFASSGPSGMSARPDGWAFYVLDPFADSILQFNLAVQWHIDSGGNPIEVALPQMGAVSYSPLGLCWKPDGTKLYVSSSWVGPGVVEDAIFEYDVSTPWNINTISYGGRKLDYETLIGGKSGGANGLTFSTDGQYLFIATQQYEFLYKLYLSTPWDITTATIAQTWNPATFSYVSGVGFGPIVGLPANNELETADSKTIYPYDIANQRYWLEWADDVDVAPGPVKNDVLKRLYYTGDGVPKMTTATLFSMGGGKYPRSWRPLGVPAPAGAPTVSATLPDLTVSGNITSLTCSSLKMIHELAGRDGRNSGNNQTLINASTTPVDLITLTPGMRVKVATIVDANNVTITGVGDIDYACAVDKRNYGLKWQNGTGLWRRRKKAYWNFLIPSGATLAITNHGLKTGDIIQIVAVTSQMAWSFAQLTTSPNTGQYTRTATKVGGGNFVFSGEANFIVDRGSTTLDPTVPRQEYDIEARAYVYTYVTDLGEESAPSPASDVVEVAVGDPVVISGFTAPPYTYYTKIRIYRTNTGSDTTEFQFVAEIDSDDASYTDTLGGDELGEVLQTDSWLPPPSDLIGLIMLPNGSACGFTGKRLCFSEPGYPHAWPPEYERVVDYDIVGIEGYGQSVLLATEGTPYVATGTHPRNVSVRRITDQLQACISKRSVVSTAFGVTYASTEGMLRISENGVENITARFLTPHQWKTLVGVYSTDEFDRLCAWHENTLYMFVRNETDNADVGAYSFRSTDQRIDFVEIGSVNSGIERFATAVYSDPLTGQLYYVDGKLIFSNYEDQVVAGGSGAVLSTWESKIFSLPYSTNLAYAQVSFRAPALDGTDCKGQLTIKYLDSAGNTVTDAENTLTFLDTTGIKEIRRPDVIRLPAGVRSDSVKFELKLNGPVVVDRVQLSDSIDDIK